MNAKTLCLAGLAAALYAVPAAAHHSFAMFDQSKTTTLSGTIRQFEWLNPHCWVHLETLTNGKATEWSFEAGSTGQLASTGWKHDSLKPGDKISITFHPLKDGSHGGQVLNVKLADGSTLCQGRACRKALGIRNPEVVRRERLQAEKKAKEAAGK